MTDLSSVGKWLVVIGLVLVGIGVLLWASGKIQFLGRLPGDIRIEGEHFQFYFPLATCLLLSVLVSLIFWMVSKFK
jgi:hypothetical protein